MRKETFFERILESFLSVYSGIVALIGILLGLIPLLKYGPDTPEDPVNATVGTGGGGDATGSVGGQSATINEFVQKCVGNSPKQDMATVQKLYDCLNQLIIYELYECSV